MESSLCNAGSNQQYGRLVNVRTLGVQEEENENVYQTVIKLANKQEVKYPERTSASVTE